MAHIDNGLGAPLVAPFTGAWIEMDDPIWSAMLMTGSLPSRERGLKFRDHLGVMLYIESLPSRERGLKFVLVGMLTDGLGRSLHGSVD